MPQRMPSDTLERLLTVVGSCALPLPGLPAGAAGPGPPPGGGTKMLSLFPELPPPEPEPLPLEPPVAASSVVGSAAEACFGSLGWQAITRETRTAADDRRPFMAWTV